MEREQTRNYTTSSLIDVFQASMLPELNIYNQAQLEIDTPFLKTTVIHAKTNHELGVVLKLEGDIEGEVYCFLDTYQKDISETEGNFFKTLYIESINILMGQIMTNLENEHNINCLISHPQFLDKFCKSDCNSQGNNIIMNVGYKFISIHNEFDCRIIFNITK